MIGLHFNIDRRGEVVLEDLGKLGDKFPKFADRAIGSAFKSEGFRLRGIVRESIQKGGPSGAKWQKLNPHTGVLNRGKKKYIKNYRISRKGVKKGEAGKRVYRDKEGKIRQKLSKKVSPLLKFAGGVRYKYKNEVLDFGFLGGSKYRGLVKKHAEGYSTPVTPKGRRRAFALGFPLKKETTRLVTPKRPLIEPIFRAEESTIKKNVREKFEKNIDRYLKESFRK